MKLLAFVLFFISCGHFDPNYFQDEFKQKANIQITIPIKIVQKIRNTDKPSIKAMCYLKHPRDIEVLAEFWYLTTESQRRILIFHELGHCSLDRMHIDVLVGSKPISIMYPWIPDDVTYNACKDQYEEELLTGNRIPIAECLYKLQNK